MSGKAALQSNTFIKQTNPRMGPRAKRWLSNNRLTHTRALHDAASAFHIVKYSYAATHQFFSLW